MARNRNYPEDSAESLPEETYPAAEPLPEAQDAPADMPAEAVAEAPAPENAEEEHVPLSAGKGGCYVIREDGKRVRVTD